MSKLTGQARDDYIERIGEIVSGRCHEANITHPEDIANQFITVAEIIGAYANTPIEA